MLKKIRSPLSRTVVVICLVSGISACVSTGGQRNIAIGPQDTAVVIGVRLDSKFAHQDVWMSWKEINQADRNRWMVARPEFCNSVRCSNHKTRYDLIKIEPGRYALAGIGAQWLGLPDSIGSNFYDSKNGKTRPRHLEFTARRGEIVYIGDYTIRPILTNYRKLTPKIGLQVTPKFVYAVSGVEFNREKAQSHSQKFVGPASRVVVREPGNLWKIPIYPEVANYTFDMY